MRKKIFSWLAMFMACLLFGGMLTPIANAAVKEENVYPPEHDGYIALSQYVQHVEDNIFKVQLTLETYAQSTTADIVMVIDASENMILRQEGTKTYFENALDAVYRSAEIWLSPGKNPLDAKSANRNRLWVIFYNGKAYDIKSNVIASGNKNSSVYCYISDESFSNPKSRDFAGKDTGIAYRSFSDMRSDLDGVASVVRSKSTLITTSPGAFNNDIKAYQERYTAAGLAAAYDVFADYSKTENIKTESNRKILYLLSNGPDYERDNVHLAGTGAPIATISSSRIPQEGSMRMEALFMAKALKLQMHSYGTGTETSLKTAAKQIAASEGNSYNTGVVQPPSLGGAGVPSYSPLSLDAHRVIIDPPDIKANPISVSAVLPGVAGAPGSRVAEVTRYIGSRATESSVPESSSFGGQASVDSHPYDSTALNTPIAWGALTDPFNIVNGLIPTTPGATAGTINMNTSNSGLNHWGVVTNMYNAVGVSTTPTATDPPALPAPPASPIVSNINGAFGSGALFGVGHFEYQMFADTAPYSQNHQNRVAATPSEFSTKNYYLSALNTATDPPTPVSVAFEKNFTNRHNNPFTSPVDGTGTNRRPLDGYNYPFIPSPTGTTGSTYVYTYADAVGGVAVATGARPTNIPKPNVGHDNVMPLKASYERIAGGNGAFATNESGGMSVEIWSVGLFAGEEGDSDGNPDPAKAGPRDLGQGEGQRMYSMGTGYGTLDATITASSSAAVRWEQITGPASPAAGATKEQYYTDYTGYSYGHHTRPTHQSLKNDNPYPPNSASLTTTPNGAIGSVGFLAGGKDYGLTYENGYSNKATSITGTPALEPTPLSDIYKTSFVERENQEVVDFLDQGQRTITTTAYSQWDTGTTGYGWASWIGTTSTWNQHYWNYGNYTHPTFGTASYQEGSNTRTQPTISGGNITNEYFEAHYQYAPVPWGPAVDNGFGAAFSYIPPNPVLPASAADIQAHYSPNIGIDPAVALGGFVPGSAGSNTMALNAAPGIGQYKSNGDGGADGPTSVHWFELIDWHEKTGAEGKTTQNDDSEGSIKGEYNRPNIRHNIWAVATISAETPLTGPGSIPRDHLIYNGTGVTNEKTASNNEKRSELQQHLWAISGVQTSKSITGANALNDPSGFDPTKPWQNKVKYYWSKQTFLTTARMRRDNTIERVRLKSDTNYSKSSPTATNTATKYAFSGPVTTGLADVINIPYHVGLPTGGVYTYTQLGGATRHTLNSTVTWRYPWTDEDVAPEGYNSVNRDFQNFYEYAGFNYDFSAYQTALDQTLNSLRWNHPLETYDAEDHVPIVKMLHKQALNTKKNSIYDIDPDEHDQYDRLVRVFEDLTYDFYRVADKGGRAIVQLSEYFDLYKMPGIPEFEYYVNAKIFPFRYRKKMGGTASYNSGDKKMAWTFDQGVYAGVRYQLSFYVRMNRETDPTQKYPFQVNSYLDRFRFKSMVRYSGRENNNRHIVTKNFPSSFVSGIKGINDIASNVVIMNDYTPNTIDGSGNVLSSMGNGSGSNTAAIGSAPGGGGAALQKTVPIYTASVTPAPKKLIDEGVDEGTEEVPVTGVFGVAAVVVVGGLLVVAIVIKRRSTVDR